MKIAIIIGHTELASGSFSKHLGDSEWDFWLEYAEEYLEDVGHIFTHDKDINSYTLRQKAIAVRTKDYDLAIELHFNGANGKAHGSECLHYKGNDITRKVSQYFSGLCEERLGYRNRGAKGREKKSRGGGFLYYQKPSALLTEAFFGDNLKDCNRFDKVKFKHIIKDTVLYFSQLTESK